MKVLRLHGAADLRLHDETMPVPAPGETLLQVRAVGICGSDLHWLEEGGIGDAQLANPLVLGHEFAATTGTGERVAVDPAIPCGECEMCRIGNPNLCERLLFAGHGTQDGGLRESLTWPTKNLHRLPDALSYVEGAMLEPLGVALHAVDLGRIRVGMTVGVFGCGPIGLLILQLARAAGATSLIATDRLAHRMEAAKSFGAQHVFAAQDGNEVHEIRSVTGGRGVDLAFEVAGEQEAVDVAVGSATPAGTVVLAGIPAGDHTSFQASVARRKGLTIKMVRRMKHTYPRAIKLVEAGMIDVRSIVTHRFPLARATEAFKMARRRDGLKVIIEPA